MLKVRLIATARLQVLSSHIVSRRKVTMDNSERGTDAKQPTIADTDTKKPATVEEWKEHYLKMSLENKRKQYRCGCENLVELTSTDIQRWPDYAKNNKIPESGKDIKCDKKLNEKIKFNYDKELNEKIAIFRGDITMLEIDAIVNAANRSLLGGGGVDGAIHRAAGKQLLNECRELNGCPTGEAKTTGGYMLPAKYIIHTVGPMGEDSKSLKSCYENCLRELTQLKLRSIAFPCVSTGIYGYDNGKAADVVLRTVREWLEKADNRKKVDIIVFCLFMDVDKKYYEKKLPVYFPLTSGGKPADTNCKGSPKGAAAKGPDSQSAEVLPQVHPSATESEDSQADDSAAESEGAEAGNKRAKLDKQASDVRKQLAGLKTGNTQPTDGSTEHAEDDMAKDTEDVLDAENTKTADNTQHVSNTQQLSTDKSQQVSASDTKPSDIDSATQPSVPHTDTFAESADAKKLDEIKPSSEESDAPKADSAGHKL